MYKGEGFKPPQESEDRRKLERGYVDWAKNFNELFLNLREVKSLTNPDGVQYDAEYLIKAIRAFRKGTADVNTITRAGGLRLKVEKLVFLENEAKRLAEEKKEKELENKILAAKRILANSPVVRELWPKGLGAKTQQGGAGDCYFLAALHAIERNPLSAVVLTRILERNGDKRWFRNDGWKVRFDDRGQTRQYVVTKSDLREMKLSGKASSASAGNVLLERAYARFIHQKKADRFHEDRSGHTVRPDMEFEGGQSHAAMGHLLGTHNLENFIVAAQPDNMLKTISQVNKKQILCVYSLFSGPEKYSAMTVKNKKFNIHSKHAYSVGNVNAEERWLEVVDPHDTENHTYKISFKEFTNKFSYLVGVELNDKFLDTI